jgi:hypothetical protein
LCGADRSDTGFVEQRRCHVPNEWLELGLQLGGLGLERDCSACRCLQGTV